MRSEVEYFRMQEEAADGAFIAECAKAIFDAHDVETMSQLQQALYRFTDAGIAISFELHEGSVKEGESAFVYVGDPRAATITQPWHWIRAIGASSIVEGSDAEVPLEWIDLARYLDDDKYGEDAVQVAVADFDKLCEEVNAEACRLWEEANEPL